ncbi:inverted formin-2 [Bilophila sp.]|uniref:inverted formin-2 n=1 Tax=Bilophila sp. TaxID=1929485 RepID=UPI00257E3477|nr:inverted formin-2 [Bilophila sp.]MBS5454395.1 inverted formin-2 [Bilophila sp.]
MAEDWAEDLAEFSPGTVEKAVKRYRRESPYFPTVADIWARCDELRRGETALADALALPGRTLTREEQRMLNGEWCAKILANLRCKMDARKQGRPDTPLDEQLANLWALGVEQ